MQAPENLSENAIAPRQKQDDDEPPSVIGLIRGAGTGGRLIKIFKDFLETVSHIAGKEVTFLRDIDKNGKEHIYHSYKSLIEASNDAKTYKELSKEDAQQLFETMKKWYEKGIRYVFRTSINAEALYSFRKQVGAVKEFVITTNSGNRLLFIRDQTEGYYANDRYKVSEDKITFEGSYSKKKQQQIAQYAFVRGSEVFGDGNFNCWGLYKHHLFGDIFHNWIKELQFVQKHIDDYSTKNKNPKNSFYKKGFELIQPDTGFFEISKFLVDTNEEEKTNIVVFCSNEVGDIITEPILAGVNIDAKIEAYARNIYLNPPFFEDKITPKNNNFSKFTEFQTVHGSADDIANGESKETLLPYATLRIAATIGEEYLAIPNLRVLTERGIIQSKISQDNSTAIIVKTVTDYVKKNLIDYGTHASV